MRGNEEERPRNESRTTAVEDGIRSDVEGRQRKQLQEEAGEICPRLGETYYIKNGSCTTCSAAHAPEELQLCVVLGEQQSIKNSDSLPQQQQEAEPQQKKSENPQQLQPQQKKSENPQEQLLALEDSISVEVTLLNAEVIRLENLPASVRARDVLPFLVDKMNQDQFVPVSLCALFNLEDSSLIPENAQLTGVLPFSEQFIVECGACIVTLPEYVDRFFEAGREAGDEAVCEAGAEPQKLLLRESTSPNLEAQHDPQGHPIPAPSFTSSTSSTTSSSEQASDSSTTSSEDEDSSSTITMSRIDLWRELIRNAKDREKCRVIAFHMLDEELNAVRHTGHSANNSIFTYVFECFSPFLELGWKRAGKLLLTLVGTLLETGRVTSDTLTRENSSGVSFFSVVENCWQMEQGGSSSSSCTSTRCTSSCKSASTGGEMNSTAGAVEIEEPVGSENKETTMTIEPDEESREEVEVEEESVSTCIGTTTLITSTRTTRSCTFSSPTSSREEDEISLPSSLSSSRSTEEQYIVPPVDEDATVDEEATLVKRGRWHKRTSTRLRSSSCVTSWTLLVEALAGSSCSSQC
ncbi:unnamed protein product [Amoebophrya sp. A25]|nr:unnamed protein product [Amoebophrya sp. A25]|eukprot:GSA25T00022874001.1